MMLSSCVGARPQNPAFGTLITLLFVLLAYPSSGVSQQSLPDVKGPRVALDLKGDGQPLILTVTGYDGYAVSGAGVEGILDGYPGDSIRIVNPDDGSIRVFARDQVSQLWVEEIRTERRTGQGFFLGALIGGGIAWVVDRHNGGSPSCETSNASLAQMICAPAQAARILVYGGGVAIGGLVGGLIGHRIRVEKVRWAPFPLPAMAPGLDGRVHIEYSVPSSW